MKKKCNHLWDDGIHRSVKKIFTVMKLTVIISLFVITQAFALKSYSQKTLLNLKMTNVSLKDVLREIEEKSDFYFLYNNDLIDVNRSVTIDAKDEKIQDVLSQLFADKTVSFLVKDRQIVLSPAGTVNAFAQQKRTVSGKVVDSTGGALPGVSVVLKGTTNGTITDMDGKFALSNIPENGTLQFSFVGMKLQEIPVEGKTSFSVTMVDETIGIEEVVAVGYGVQKKSDVTGSLVRVGAEEIKSRPVTNAVQAIQGRAAGVDITSNERPGTVGDITIRGVRSLTASNSPLYVVDGIPLVTGTVDAGGNTSNKVTLGGIDNMNPNDIESIDILKDASATAIYGSRGANGVVLITTKKGKSGKFALNFDSSVTTEQIHEFSPLFSAGDYITYRRWAKFYNGESTVRGDQPTQANDAKIFTGDDTAWANILKGWSGSTWDGSKLTTTNWTDYVTRTGITTQNTLSASGGTDKMKAYGSFGYTDSKGVVKGQGFKRYNANVSVDITPLKWFSFGGNLNSSYSIQEYGQSTAGNVGVSAQTGLYQSAYGIFTYALPYDVNGNRIEYPGGDIAVKTIIDEEKYSQDQRVTFRTFGSFYGQIDFGNLLPVLKGLRFRTNFGPDIQTWRDGIYDDGKSVIRSGSAYASLEKKTTTVVHT
jgi:TonB-linked outer membrane protein, SusC/RagA family